MSASRYVCAKDGLAVRPWGRNGSTFWKHCSGGRSNRSCGSTPDVMARADYERQARLQAQVNAVADTGS